jgi:hypothetical protein
MYIVYTRYTFLNKKTTYIIDPLIDTLATLCRENCRAARLSHRNDGVQIIECHRPGDFARSFFLNCPEIPDNCLLPHKTDCLPPSAVVVSKMEITEFSTNRQQRIHRHLDRDMLHRNVQIVLHTSVGRPPAHRRAGGRCRADPRS